MYVQYQNEHEAVKAYAKFNGRFYAGRQISCEFVKIEKWKSAICGELVSSSCAIMITLNVGHQIEVRNCSILVIFQDEIFPPLFFLVIVPLITTSLQASFTG